MNLKFPYEALGFDAGLIGSTEHGSLAGPCVCGAISRQH